MLSETLGNIEGVTRESLESFVGRHEEDIALVLDGYDEYKGTISSSSKQVKSNVVQTLLNKKYRNCRTVVTCRPFLERDFTQPDLARVYTKMKINGFTKPNVASYTLRSILNQGQK